MNWRAEMVETFSVEGDSTHQDAMRKAGGAQGTAVVCVYDGRNEEPKAFLVVNQELIDHWQGIIDKAK